MMYSQADVNDPAVYLIMLQQYLIEPRSGSRDIAQVYKISDIRYRSIHL